MVDVAKLAQKAMKTASDVADATEPVTFVRSVPGNYNPTTGVPDETLTEYVIERALLTDISEAEQRMLGPVDKLTQKMIIAALDLAIVPARSDYVVDADGIRWEILRIKKVPGGSIYIVYLMGP